MVDWLLNGGMAPLLEIFSQASVDMVDIHTSLIFQALQAQDNYLRIQDDELSGIENSVDVATNENMERLVAIGERLLKSQLSRIDLFTVLIEPVNGGGTNEDALKRCASIMSSERKLRLAPKNSEIRREVTQMKMMRLTIQRGFTI